MSDLDPPFRGGAGLVLFALVVAALVAAVSSLIELGMLRDPSFDPIATILSTPFLRDFVPSFLQMVFTVVLVMAFDRWRERRQRRSSDFTLP